MESSIKFKLQAITFSGLYRHSVDCINVPWTVSARGSSIQWTSSAYSVDFITLKI